MTETSIIPEAMRFTMDSRASDRRATDPEMLQATSFNAKMNKPPAKAISAALLFLNSQSIPTPLLLGVSTEARSISRRTHSRHVESISDILLEKGVFLNHDY
jgi:hypothetical protein